MRWAYEGVSLVVVNGRSLNRFLHPSHHLISLLRPEPSEGESLFKFFTYAVNDVLRSGIRPALDLIASGFYKALIAVEVVGQFCIGLY